MAGGLGLRALAVGLAQGALDESVKFARGRGLRLGRRLGSFKAIQWMLADMHTEIEAARGVGVSGGRR